MCRFLRYWETCPRKRGHGTRLSATATNKGNLGRIFCATRVGGAVSGGWAGEGCRETESFVRRILYAAEASNYTILEVLVCDLARQMRLGDDSVDTFFRPEGAAAQGSAPARSPGPPAIRE